MKRIILKVIINFDESDLDADYIEKLAIDAVADNFPGVLGDGEIWVNDTEIEVLK
jgi:hypothetical protein